MMPRELRDACERTDSQWIIELFERVELRQHARDRVAEREDIELGWLDLGEAGA